MQSQTLNCTVCGLFKFKLDYMQTPATLSLAVLYYYIGMPAEKSKNSERRGPTVY